MIIMPNSFHVASFTGRSLRKIEAALENTMSDEELEKYINSLVSLPLKSSSVSKVNVSEGTSGPNVVGYNYSADVTIVLEGVVYATSAPSDDELKTDMMKDLKEFWYDEDRLSSLVNELTDEFRTTGSNPEQTSNVNILSFSRNPDGTANVTLELTVTVENGESVYDRNSRIRSEQGEHEHDLQHDVR